MIFYRAMNRFIRHVDKIKKNLKVHLRHSKIKYCIMNYQWSEIEKQEVRMMKNKKSPKKTHSVIHSSGKEVVPVEIRLFYLRE